MTQYKQFSLGFLNERPHPEMRHSNFQIQSFRVRRGDYNIAISHHGEILRFAVKNLPQKTVELKSYCSMPFNRQSLNLKWFEKLDKVQFVSATIHGRHAFWLVHPDLEEHLDIPILPSL